MENMILSKLREKRLLSTALILATLAIGIVLGSLITGGVSAQRQQSSAPDATPLTVPDPVQMNNTFAQIAKRVSPSVVNINTEAIVQNSPWQVRSVIAALAARTPEQDRRFPWPDEWSGGRPSTAPLNRFLVFPDQPGAARVRRLVTEIQAPNLVPR